MSGKPANTNKIIAKRTKKKKPEFRRQESWRQKRIKENWRKPRGLDSKMRKRVKGWPSSPRIGYRGPKSTRGLHPSGLREVRVFNVDDLGRVNPELEAILVAHTVGSKKRAEILNRAKEMGIRVLNPEKIEELEEPVTEKAETKAK